MEGTPGTDSSGEHQPGRRVDQRPLGPLASARNTGRQECRPRHAIWAQSHWHGEIRAVGEQYLRREREVLLRV